MKYKTLTLLLAMLATSTAAATETAENRACYDAMKADEHTKVLQHCEQLANSGDPIAATAMAISILTTKTRFLDTSLSEQEMMQRKFKLPVDEQIYLTDAMAYLRDAAEAAHPEAQLLLALVIRDTVFNRAMFGKTINLNEEYDKADQLLYEAAKNGHPDAIEQTAREILTYDNQNNLVDVKEDYFPFLQKMVAAKDPEFIEINTIYMTFVEQAKRIQKEPNKFDAAKVTEEALRLLNKPNQAKLGQELLTIAAQRGDGEANFQFAQYFDKKQPKKALEYFIQAANAKHAKAALWLGEYFGCKKDAKQAIKWIQIAVDAGNSNAEESLEEIKQYGDIAECSQYEKYEQ